MPATEDKSLNRWIEYVFDHAVAEPAWFWASEIPGWEGTAEQIVLHIAETFEQSKHLLARFSDAQLNQGLWFLVSNGFSDYMFTLVDPKLALSQRLRALRSFVPLFEQVMAVRCSPHLSYLDEPGANPLNSVCYMWWDILPICGSSENSARAEFDSEVLLVLRRILAIPHDACRESALHGLGHWAYDYPAVGEIIGDFLSHNPGLRPHLVAYAERAKTGGVL